GVLERPRPDPGASREEVAGLAPRWQGCHLGGLPQVRALPRLRLGPQLLVLLQLEEERRLLAGAQLPARQRGPGGCAGTHPSGRGMRGVGFFSFTPCAIASSRTCADSSVTIWRDGKRRHR